MKISNSTSSRRGSTLLTVVFLAGLMAILTASMLSYSSGEKRGNERNRLALRSKNMAENVALYAAEQLTTKLYRLGSAPIMEFPTTGESSNKIYPPPDHVLTTAFTSPSGIELRAGIEDATDLTLVNDASSPNNGLQVSTARVPIIAKATASHPALGSITSYVQQDMELALTPLFQFGMFYNMDMEFYPSQTFTVAGPVHTNNRLIAHPDGASTIAITFLNRVTAAAGVYWNTAMKAKPRGANGTESLPTEANGDVKFTPIAGSPPVPVTLKESSKWRDHMYKTATETTSTLALFKTFATNTYGGNLRTNVHGVTKLELPGVGTYNETDDPSTTDDERNNGRQLIEPPNPKKWNGSTWATVADDADTKESKISRKAGLYIVVNPDDDAIPRSFNLPDDSVKYVLPRSYRAWLNIRNSGVSTMTEIVLPGQPTYGYDAGTDGLLGTSDDRMFRNYLPNRHDATTVCGDGTGNQLLRIPQSGFGMSSGYLINGAHATGATSLAVDTGTGPILAGESITIGGHQYFVISDLSAGVVKIAAPGLRANVADNTALSANPMDSRGTGTGYLINNGAGYAIGATSLTLDTGNGTILPGNTITIGAHNYLVASAFSANVVTIADPGLRAAVGNNDAVTINAASGTVGTGEGYFINNAAGYPIGATSLALDTGSGTILPGNALVIGGNRYAVASALSGGVVTICSPGLVEAVTDNTLVIVDPFETSGYSTSTISPNFATNSGSTFPNDTIAAAPFTYFPADAYFFDLRRANGNRGVISVSGTTGIYRRDLVNYVPRAIAKIDFDMSRFKMMVDRVMNAAEESNVYDVRAPSAGATWANSIFNAAGVRNDFGLGMGAAFDVFPADTSTVTRTRQDPFQLYYAPASPASAATITQVMTDPTTYAVPPSALYHASAPSAWYDGIAIYVHSVDAEMRAQTANVPNRTDSAVRLINGRGSVASLTPIGKTGCTFVTNDAVYIIGHYNADGTIDATDTDVGTGAPNYYGGYSARYPDGDTEKLCAVMGDAFTALAQPVWTSNTSGQVNGWNDALSALPVVASSAGWRSTSPLAGNDDGVRITTAADGPRPGLLPTHSYPGPTTLTAGTRTIRLPAVNTEMSTALLMGIVPSNHNPTGLTDFAHAPPGASANTYLANGVNSGGANNFPRLGDDWSGDGLYIRGSIVALFESRVAMEPFTNSRNYRAPGRYWGLHYNFSTPDHDIPLEPIVLSNTRVGFRELTATEYNNKKTIIEALP